MCDRCEQLQKQIAKYNEFLNEPFDPLTRKRLKAAVAALEQLRAELH